MTTIITICARGGSKGVPGKNIRELNGKPLIVHSIEQGLATPDAAGVFVSTDDPDIASVAQNAGAKVPGMRPPSLATDDAPKIPVIRDLVDRVKDSGIAVEKVVDLDATSPLRSLEDIAACLKLLTKDVDVVITGYAAEKNPYFNMVEPQPEGGYDLVKRPAVPVTGRQAAPSVFAMNASVYAWWEDTIENGLFGPRTAFHEMPRERSIDIDSPLDFELVELLMKKMTNGEPA